MFVVTRIQDKPDIFSCFGRSLNEQKLGWMMHSNWTGANWGTTKTEPGQSGCRTRLALLEPFG